MKGLLGSAVAAKAAAKMKMQAFKAKEKNNRLEQLEAEFTDQVKKSKEYQSALKMMNDDIFNKLSELPDFDDNGKWQIHSAVAPKIPDWGKSILKACFLCVGDEKDRLNNAEAENKKMTDKLMELQKRSLQEVVALREKNRDFSPEEEREMEEVSFYDPLDFLPPNQSELCKSIIQEAVKKFASTKPSLANPRMSQTKVDPNLGNKEEELARVKELEEAKATLQKSLQEARTKIMEMESTMEESESKKSQHVADLRDARKLLQRLSPQTGVMELPASFQGFHAQFVLPDVKINALEPLGAFWTGNGVGYGPCRDNKAEAEKDIARFTEAVDKVEAQRAKVDALDKIVRAVLQECIAGSTKPEAFDGSMQTELDDSCSVDAVEKVVIRKQSKDAAIDPRPITPKVEERRPSKEDFEKMEQEALRLKQAEQESLRSNDALQKQLDHEREDKAAMLEAKEKLEKDLAETSSLVAAMQEKISVLEQEAATAAAAAAAAANAEEEEKSRVLVRRASNASGSSEIEDLKEQIDEQQTKIEALNAEIKKINLLMWEMQERIVSLRDRLLKAGVPPDVLKPIFEELGVDDCTSQNKTIHDRLYEDALERFNRHRRRADVIKLFKKDLEYYKNLYVEMVRKKKTLIEATSPKRELRSREKILPGIPIANPEHVPLPLYPRPSPRAKARPAALDLTPSLTEFPSPLSASQAQFYMSAHRSPKQSTQNSALWSPSPNQKAWPQSCPSGSVMRSVGAPPAPSEPFRGPRLGPEWRMVQHPQAAAVVNKAKMMSDFLGGRFQIPNGGIPSPSDSALPQPKQLPPLEDVCVPALNQPEAKIPRSVSTPVLNTAQSVPAISDGSNKMLNVH